MHRRVLAGRFPATTFCQEFKDMPTQSRGHGTRRAGTSATGTVNDVAVELIDACIASGELIAQYSLMPRLPMVAARLCERRRQ
jgi:hypothetical protein